MRPRSLPRFTQMTSTSSLTVFEKRIFCGGNIDLQNPEPDDTRNRMKPGVSGSNLVPKLYSQGYIRLRAFGPICRSVMRSVLCY